MKLGVRHRMAWNWMWLLPCGYCFLLQAGSISNDFFGAFFCLCAIEFAFRARRSERLLEVWLSILAVSLMIATKAFNLLLLLPWGLAILPVLPLLFRRPIPSAVALLVAAAASFLPTAWLNFQNCGDWKGQAAEQHAQPDRLHHPDGPLEAGAQDGGPRRPQRAFAGR